jgi:MFS family permease
LIGAAPQIAGLLRLGAPAMIARLADRKRFCIAAFLLGVVPLAMIPLVCRPGLLPSPSWSLAALILLWCLHQLLQYLATVALFSWLADVAPTRIRGRFFGWRQRWIMAGTAVAAVIATMATTNAQEKINEFVREADRAFPTWAYYGFLMGLGAAFLLLALAPLKLMPSCQRSQPGPRSPGKPEASWTTPFRDPRFLRLLTFGCWFSFFNGITQAAQGYYPLYVLHLAFKVPLALQTGTNLGQWAVSPWVGRLADRLGNRPVMFVSQLLVAVGMLFFVIATPSQWWWLIGASVLWIAYAGMNVCLPNLMLKLAPRQSNASYIAAFETVRGLCFAASAILGGLILDRQATWTGLLLGGFSLSFFPCVFIFGWIVRSLGAFVLLWVVEPATLELKER